MTISSSDRKAGPFTGNDVTTAFPFAFKVFSSADVYAVQLEVDTEIESVLVINTDYTISLNGNQNTNPGGTLTLTDPLATGYRLTITSNIEALQATDLTNQGGFYPSVITNALDKLTILIQQALEVLSRSLKLPLSVSESVSPELPLPEADKFLAWNSDADGLQNVDSATLATIVAFGTANADVFDGDGTTTAFVLSDNPGALNNLDVAIGGVTQVPGLDYTWTSGTTITFTSAPPLGTDNILVRYMQALPQGLSTAASTEYTPAGVSAVETDVQSKLREIVSVKDFGATGDGSTDDTTAIQAAVDEVLTSTGGAIYFPDGTYKITAAIEIPFSTGWRLFGASHKATIKQFTANTPCLTLVDTLTHSWEISDLTFTYNVAQVAANTNAIAIKFATGLAGDTFFNFQIRRCSFANCFRAIASDSSNSPSVWGVHISDCVFQGSMTGAAVRLVPSPAVGQPNINIDSCYVDSAAATEQGIYISSGDNVTLRNVEFNNGSSALSSSGQVYIPSCASVAVIGCKSELWAFGAASTILWDFAGSYVTAINCSFNGFTGTANPKMLGANSSGKLCAIGVHVNSSMSGGNAVPYVASDIVFASNISTTGLATKLLRSVLGSVAMPRIDTDKTMPNEYAARGDVSVTLTATDYRLQYFNTTLTANRTVDLPSTGLYDGLEFEIVRYNATPGAFTLTVSDPVSGKSYVIASGDKGFVKWRCMGTGEWLPVSAGTF